MLRGLPASIVLHLVVFSGGAFVLPYAGGSLSSESIIVPIEIVEAGLITDIAPAPDPDQDTTPEQPPIEEPDFQDLLEDIDTLPELEEETVPEEAIADPEPSLDPSTDASPEALPETTPTIPEELPEETPAEETEPVTEEIVPEYIEPEPDAEKIEPEPEPEIAPPPPPQKKQTAPVDPLKDLLSQSRRSIGDRKDRAQSQTQNTSQTRSRTPLKDEADTTPRRSAGERERLIASYAEIIRTKMRVCWGDTRDYPNPERYVVTLKVRLNVDGSLDGAPELIKPRRIAIGDTFMNAAVTEAKRATRNCAPYKFPREDYDVWKSLDFEIGPESR